MHSTRKFINLLLVLSMFILTTSCQSLTGGNNQGIQASGVVEAVEVVVSAETGGRVAEVFVSEGDQVQPGDPLFRIEDDLLQAQKDQANAGLAAAQATLQTAQDGAKFAENGVSLAQAQLDTAQASLDVSQLQSKETLNEARSQDQSKRDSAWSADTPNEFDLPVWYYQKSEEMTAAETELITAEKDLEAERANFQSVIQDSSHIDLAQAESRLAEAQAAFLVAQDVLDQAKDARDKPELEKYAQDVFDSAKSELDAAQSDYDQLLSEQTASDVLEARARLAVAERRYQIALDRYNQFLTGSDALSVQISDATLKQSESAVNLAKINIDQAQANLDQANSNIALAQASMQKAQADLDLINLQMERLVVNAPVAATVMTRSIQPGEVIQPGVSALTLGELDHLRITIYVPENLYGQISLGDKAQVTSDSFPGESFEAVVSRIANQAEYTPRNVQTQSERSTTVYAIELSVVDAIGKLKPGMPTDVKFSP